MDILFHLPVISNYTVVCLGNFDGIHKGHQQLITEAVNHAKDLDLPSMVLTLDPHPETILRPKGQLKKILTNELKSELMAKLGVDILVYLPFTREIAQMTPEDFITKVLVKNCKAAHVFTGFNYTFGKSATGDVTTLQKFSNQLGYTLHVMPPYSINNNIVSSSLIRNFLKKGKVEQAKELLGYWPILRGEVVHGDQRGGSILGFPTANINVESNLLVPADGVYASTINYNDKNFFGMTNIGSKPTVGKNLPQTIEVNIFDFECKIYGKTLTIQLRKYLRPEKKFLSLDQLKQQLFQDQIDSINYLQQTCY